MGLQCGMQALQVDAVLRAEAFMADPQCCCTWPFVSGEKWLRFGFLKPSAAVPASRGSFQHAWAVGMGQVGRQGRCQLPPLPSCRERWQLCFLAWGASGVCFPLCDITGPNITAVEA